MSFSRYVAIGDLQTTFQRFMDVLDAQDLLTDQKRLKSDVGLMTVGDYYDFKWDGHSRHEIAAEGVRIVDWLMSHSADQVRVLLGNHDICRVMEFAQISDAEFETAYRSIQQLDKTGFMERFPWAPGIGVVGRDFCSFQERQRRQIQAALLSQRVRLADTIETADGHHWLISHAGVTDTQMKLLGIVESEPMRIAKALNHFLDERVRRVARDWESNRNAALDLRPLHIAGRDGREGDGLLYQRPTTHEADRPRRFSVSDLPRGLRQVCGHTQHAKMTKLAPDLAEHADINDGELRTLVLGPSTATYRMGAHSGDDDDAVLCMIDSGLNRYPAQSISVFNFTAWH